MGESSPGITVQPMRLCDIPKIVEIERYAFTTPWSKNAFLSELLENDRAYYLVAQIGNVVVGYVGVWLIAGEGHITNVAVHPDYRHQGVGRTLMQAIIECARAKKVRRMTLEVRRTNYIAQSLYEQLGFKGAGYRRGYYSDNNEDALIMWKELDPEHMGEPV